MAESVSSERLEGGRFPIWPSTLERALRLALRAHQGQERKGSPGVPYSTHVVAVSWILQRFGFGDEAAAAGLLHDVVEDTSISLDELRREFGEEIASLVAACSELKLDEEGRKRPWAVRKREALDGLCEAPVEARAVALADKLHNLICIESDLIEGRDVWPSFNAERESVLAYYREAARRWVGQDPRTELLGAACDSVLDRIECLSGR